MFIDYLAIRRLHLGHLVSFRRFVPPPG
jgi:hypothetical protein